MLVSANWIEDFLEEPLTAEERENLGETLTLHTAEVDAVTPKGAHLASISVAHIEKIEPHPDADKLRLATVRIGDGSKQRVVCGAPNIEEGMKVPYAPLGTAFPNGLVLEAKKIRGIVSEGMLCSEAELELGEDHGGILVLSEDAEIGTPLDTLLQQTPDLVIDIDNKAITHRPDLWGHRGIARDCAAVLKRAFHDRYDEQWLEGIEAKVPADTPPVPVTVDKNSCCIGYFGISVDNVKVEPSPKWMQDRLLAVGLRPINNLVDIGNYVMLEVGGPLHMFDRTKIAGNEVIIRPATEGETLELLDGHTVTLSPDDTVVADKERASVVAGIMGGEESGIQDDTKQVFIEAATWERTAIRKTSTKLGIRTDSSQRFEKGLDPQLMKTTILRALELVLELCPDAIVVGSLAYDGEDLSTISTPEISCAVSRINRLLGTDHSFEVMKETLEALEFVVAGSAENFTVHVPSFRATREFEFEADVVEEIGRVLGYGNITPTPPISPIQPTQPLAIHQVEKRVRQLLPLHGRFLEIQTYPLVGEALLERVKWKNGDAPLLLKNPLSVEQDRMRPSMIPSLIQAMSENAKYFESFRLFEVARSYHGNLNDFATESRELTLGVYSESGDDPFRPIVDVAEALLEFLGVPFQCTETKEKAPHPLLPLEWEGRHPFASRTLTGFGKNLGEVVELHPLLLRSLKMKGRAAIGVVGLDLIAEHWGRAKDSYEPLSRFPSSVFDCTVIAEPKSELESLMSVLRRFKAKEVQERSIVTEFCPTPEERYVTVRALFGSTSETLSGEKIKELESQLVQHLDKNGYPLKPG